MPVSCDSMVHPVLRVASIRDSSASSCPMQLALDGAPGLMSWYLDSLDKEGPGLLSPGPSLRRLSLSLKDASSLAAG